MHKKSGVSFDPIWVRLGLKRHNYFITKLNTIMGKIFYHTKILFIPHQKCSHTTLNEKFVWCGMRTFWCIFTNIIDFTNNIYYFVYKIKKNWINLLRPNKCVIYIIIFGERICQGSDEDHFSLGFSSRKLIKRIEEFEVNEKGIYQIDFT